MAGAARAVAVVEAVAVAGEDVAGVPLNLFRNCEKAPDFVAPALLLLTLLFKTGTGGAGVPKSKASKSPSSSSSCMSS